MPPSDSRDARGASLRLAVYAGLILFFELALIRYTSAYVKVFSFYLNFVLIAAFLGMGVGMLRAGKARRDRWLVIPGTLLLLGAVAVYSRARIAVPSDPNEFIWGIFSDPGFGHPIPMLDVVASMFALCALFFVPLGSLFGAEFRRLPALRAYTFDLTGSLAGIAAFALLSWAAQPPVIWFGIGFAVWVLLSIDDRRYLAALGVTGATALLLVARTAQGPEFWSPYYRITLAKAPGVYRVDVNGSLHQFMFDFSVPDAQQVKDAYEAPYAYAAHLDTALVVGSGTGNDVALLLASGAKYIDAVEIDPVIADIGKALHFQKPYSDPRVHLHINDARNYLRRSRRHYDVIVYGTLDSQTLLSGMSSVRLDNYVYTLEAFQAARARLKPDGTLLVYHYSAFGYIASNIYHMLTEAFGSAPGALTQYSHPFNFVFVAGHGAARVPPPPGSMVEMLNSSSTTFPEDNWPYLYLKNRTIPMHYIVALVVALLTAVLFVRVGARGAVRGGFDPALFFMGAGFLLIETKSVTEMSLIFGSTWTVNVLVFASILIMVLLANLVVLTRPPMQTAPMFAGLFLSLAVTYLLPVRDLLGLGAAGEWLAGGLMVGLPVLFASAIFSTLLRGRADPAGALAFNLLGAIVGGVLEYSSMAVGTKALYLLAAGIYALAWWASRRQAAGVTETAPSNAAGPPG